MLSMEQWKKTAVVEGITFIAPFNQQGTTHKNWQHPMGMGIGLNGNGVFLKFLQCLEFGWHWMPRKLVNRDLYNGIL